jgi:hypothetical protein
LRALIQSCFWHASIYHGIGVRVNFICDEMVGGLRACFEDWQVQTLDHRTGLPDGSHPHFTFMAVLQKGQNNA